MEVGGLGLALSRCLPSKEKLGLHVRPPVAALLWLVDQGDFLLIGSGLTWDWSHQGLHRGGL